MCGVVLLLEVYLVIIAITEKSKHPKYEAYASPVRDVHFEALLLSKLHRF